MTKNYAEEAKNLSTDHLRGYLICYNERPLNGVLSRLGFVPEKVKAYGAEFHSRITQTGFWD